MTFHSHQSESRSRRYPVLSLFDVTLNVLLSAGIFGLGCTCLGVVMAHAAPHLLVQVGNFATHLFG